MSAQELNKILDSKVKRINGMLKPFVWIAMSVGVNMQYKKGPGNRIKLLSLLLSILAFFGFGGQYYHIWKNSSRSFFVYSDAICTSFQTLISFSKLIHFALSLHKFQKLLHMAISSEILQDLEFFELNILNKRQLTQEISKIIDNSWVDIRRQILIFIVCVNSILIWYYLSSLAINYYNTYIDPKEFDLFFPFQASFPVWRDKGFQFPYYLILYIFSASETHIAGFSSITFVSFYIATVLHTLALLKILRIFIENSTTVNVLPTERVKYILAWTRLYQKIYEYYYQINSLYYKQSAPLFLVSTLVICLLIFQGSVGLGNDINMVVIMILYLSAAGFEVFTFCINGQRLTSESEKVSVDIYKTKWYMESSEYKLITRMMIMRTNRIFFMEVAGFTTMSRVTFLGIMRTSFSFFLLLSEMNDR